jgi:23S rRNA (adenine2503-C2)-methyltransferase
MGMGEPLDNYDNVIRFLKIVNEEQNLNIGYRHISLSTCGLADKIRRLSGEELPSRFRYRSTRRTMKSAIKSCR